MALRSGAAVDPHARHWSPGAAAKRSVEEPRVEGLNLRGRYSMAYGRWTLLVISMTLHLVDGHSK